MIECSKRDFSNFHSGVSLTGRALRCNLFATHAQKADAAQKGFPLHSLTRCANSYPNTNKETYSCSAGAGQRGNRDKAFGGRMVLAELSAPLLEGRYFGILCSAAGSYCHIDLVTLRYNREY